MSRGVQANCQAVGCTHLIKRGQFLCQAHWRALPAPLRRQVNETWSRRRKAMRDHGVGASAQAILDHVEACDEARRWTAEGEGLIAHYAPDADRLKRLHARAAEAAHG